MWLTTLMSLKELAKSPLCGLQGLISRLLQLKAVYSGQLPTYGCHTKAFERVEQKQQFQFVWMYN